MHRAGWLRHGVKQPESVASHMWGTALLALQYAKPYGFNEETCIQLALVHDLVEAITGDIPTDKKFLARKGAIKNKSKKEAKAVKKLLTLISDKKTKIRFEKLCLEYIRKKSREAKFVSDLGNCIDICAQALYYTQNKCTKKDLFEFFETAYLRVYTNEGKELLDNLLNEYLETRGARH